MKVLMISSDRKVFMPESSVAQRISEYGALVEELHIVVLSGASHGLKPIQLSDNVWLYPTNSFFKYLRPLAAARIGKRIIFDRKFVRGKSLITAQDPFESGWAGLKVKNKWRIPLEVQLHTDPFSPYFSGFLNKVRRFIARRVLRETDSVRVVSENVGRKIKALTNARVYVLPIYIDRARIEEGRVAFDLHSRYPWHFILLAVSRLEPEKNLGLALEALALVRQHFSDTGLVIVGSGSEEKRLKNLRDNLGLQGAVEFAGWQDDVASFYKTANIFIQTSLFEGYGLSLIEAGLSNLPIVTTAVGVAQELEHGKDAYIYSANDANMFASGIIDLLEHNHKRENLKMNMKKTLEKKLKTKEEYLQELMSEWGKTALKIA
jgi:glycosyltransferase involved in cell wall biosynthesis